MGCLNLRSIRKIEKLDKKWHKCSAYAIEARERGDNERAEELSLKRRTVREKLAKLIFEVNNPPEKLKRGIIDLHGLQKEEALHELEEFVDKQRNHQKTSVVVIVGKGKHSSGGPVLKEAVQEFADTNEIECKPDPRNEGRVILTFSENVH